MCFITKQQKSEVYLHITNLNTEKVSQAKIIDISLFKKVNISQSTHVVSNTDGSDITFTTSLNDMLSYYVLVRNAHKLGIPELGYSEIERLNNHGYPTKVSKLFKIRLEEQRAKSGYREVSIRVPSSIRVWTFVFWVQHNVTTAIGVISPNGAYHCCYWQSHLLRQSKATTQSQP